MKEKKGFVIRYHFLIIAFFVGFSAFYLSTLEHKFKGYIGEDIFYLQEARDKSYDALLYLSTSAELAASQAAYELGQQGGQDVPPCGTYYGYSLWTSSQNNNINDCQASSQASQQLFLDDTQVLLETYVDIKNSNEQFNFIPPNNYQAVILQNGYLIGQADSLMNIVMGKGVALPPTKKPVTVSVLDTNITIPLITKEESTPLLTPPSSDALPFENEAIIRNGPEFIPKVKEMSKRLGIRPECLMKAMHFESKGFNPQAVNPKSKATGLIQFMPNTARGLGTSIEELYKMNGVEQLKYVENYFAQNLRGKSINSCVDLYFVIFYPYAIGKSDSFVLGSEQTSQVSPQTIAKQNYIFDLDHDGQIKAGEVRAYKEQRGWA